MLYRSNSIGYRLLDTFFRNWWLFALGVLGTCGVVVAALTLRKPAYVAKVSIRVINGNEVNKALGFSTKQAPPGQRNVDHLDDLMQNTLPGGFVDGTLQAAKLKQPISTSPEAQDPRFAQFRRGLFTAVESRDVFTIGLTWDDKDECERLVRALQTRYIEEAGLSYQAQGVATIQLLNSEIESYRKRLSRAEQALTSYRTQHAGKLPQAQAGEAEQMASLKIKRDNLIITAKDSTLRQQAIKNRMAQIKPTSILEQTFSTDPLMVEIRSLQASRSSLIAGDHRPDGIEVGKVDKRIADLQRQMKAKKTSDPTDSRNVLETKLQDNPEYQTLSQQLTDASISQQAQQAQLALLNKQIGVYEARMQALPVQERELTERTRDYEILRQQYEDLLVRREKAQLKANVDKVTATSTMVVQNPVFAQSTTSGSKKVVMLVGSLIVGLVIGFLAVLSRELLDNSLRYGTDAARLLGVPVLATLPDSPSLRFPVNQRRATRLLPGNRPQIGSLPKATQS